VDDNSAYRFKKRLFELRGAERSRQGEKAGKNRPNRQCREEGVNNFAGRHRS